ncbi:hypothetical protein LTR67_008691 [Exophiala xenobiotica]
MLEMQDTGTPVRGAAVVPENLNQKAFTAGRDSSTDASTKPVHEATFAETSVDVPTSPQTAASSLARTGSETFPAEDFFGLQSTTTRADIFGLSRLANVELTAGQVLDIFGL